MTDIPPVVSHITHQWTNQEREDEMADSFQKPSVRVESDKGTEWFQYRTFGEARVAADIFAKFGWKATIHRMRRKVPSAA